MDSYGSNGFHGSDFHFSFNFFANDCFGNDKWRLFHSNFGFDQSKFRFDMPKWLWCRICFMQIDSTNDLIRDKINQLK